MGIKICDLVILHSYMILAHNLEDFYTISVHFSVTAEHFYTILNTFFLRYFSVIKIIAPSKNAF